MAQEPSGADKYDLETAAFASSSDFSDITDAAHCHFTIRRTVFEAERVEYTALHANVRGATVSVRGWPYPYVHRLERGDTWISPSASAEITRVEAEIAKDEAWLQVALNYEDKPRAVGIRASLEELQSRRDELQATEGADESE
jgi:hypothetical protein